jgi:glycosyltransferase involved in cell wall biosynthesis
MKILVVSHTYGLDGASAILKSTLTYWIKTLGWHVDALLKTSSMSEYKHELISLGINPVAKANIPGEYQFVLINTIINLSSIDYFYNKLPIILWVHEGSTAINSYPCPPSRLIRFFHKTNLIIFQTRWQSEIVYKSFIHELPTEKIICIPYGIESIGTNRLNRSQDKDIKVLNIGTVYPRKRQLDLAEATIKLSKKYPISSTFIGDLSKAGLYGPKFDSYRHQYPEILRWLDGISDKEKLGAEIVNASIGCFPSKDETFGIAALEMALKKIPIVLADLPVYKEVGWQDGINCLKFRVGDIDDLEKNLEKLLNDPHLQKRIAHGGHELAISYGMPNFLKNISKAVLKIN